MGTTVFQYPHIQSYYEAWEAAGSPRTIGGEDWDNPARRINCLVIYDVERGPYLDMWTWATHRYSIQGATGSTRTLEYDGSARIRKGGSMGALTGKLSFGSRALYDAHDAWVQAGRPAQFVWVA